MSTLSESSAPFTRYAAPLGQGRTASLFKGLARFILVAAIFAAPWALGAVEPWAWGSLTILAFLALILWAVGGAQRGALRIAWSPMYWPFLALLVVALGQFYFGLTLDHVATREAVLKIVANLVLFFLAGQLLNSRPENGRAMRYFGLAVTGLAFAVSVLALAQFFFAKDYHQIYWSIKVTAWPFGPYVNHNDYGGLMEMLIPISAGYLLSRSDQSLSRYLLWGVVIIALISVWVSGSRGATAAMLIEGVVFGLVLVANPSQLARRRALPLVIAVVVIAVGLFAWMIRTKGVTSRAWSIFASDKSLEVTFGDRLWVSKSALRIAADHPWIGVGVGCFEMAFPMYAINPTDLHWTHAHDDYAEALAETGLAGAVILAVALLLFFHLAFRHLRERLHHEAGWVQLGAAVGCMGLMAHSFVDFNLRVPANAAWFVVCLAMAVHPGSSRGKVRKMDRFSPGERSGGYLT